ncbi:MAG: multiprotein-bridging factor 1 family protein [Candidatus Anstonellales archaeon]
MDCEICGSPGARFEIYIEGARLTVCKACRGDKPVFSASYRAGDVKRERPEEEVVEDYGKIISGAREKAGMALEDVGKKLGISVPYLNKIEKQQLLPDEKTMEKLEKFFKIKLKQKAVPPTFQKGEKGSITIADVAEVEDGSGHK